MLPLWVQWIQAILLLIISCIGAWIAFRQAKIATAKLNLDLYEKRFDVFDAARTLVAKFLRDANINTEDIITFNIGVAEAIFLFEPEVKNYLDELRKKAAALHTKTEQLRALSDKDRRRDRLIDEIANLEQDFATEYERLIAVFKPYLKLGAI
jgi:hypothetical protein